MASKKLSREQRKARCGPPPNVLDVKAIEAAKLAAVKADAEAIVKMGLAIEELQEKVYLLQQVVAGLKGDKGDKGEAGTRGPKGGFRFSLFGAPNE